MYLEQLELLEQGIKQRSEESGFQKTVFNYQRIVKGEK